MIRSTFNHVSETCMRSVLVLWFSITCLILTACGEPTESAGAAPLSNDTPASASQAPLLPLTNILPPLSSPSSAPDYTEACGLDGLKCLRWVEAELAGWERFFGCDHRAVFPTVYRLLTQETRWQMENDPSVFQDPAGLGQEAVEFYRLYEQMIRAHLAGEAIPPAWQLVMDVALEGDWTGGHDMLMAINAHVQRDMPFAVAKTGLTLPSGESRKADHDHFNSILNRAYPRIVQAVGQRYDPIMLTVADLGVPGNLAAMQLVALWREGVWRNAERLTQSDDALTRESIEQQALITGTVMKVGEVPGRRAMRKAYCEAQKAN